jgi:excisionase family DNA binding protein
VSANGPILDAEQLARRWDVPADHVYRQTREGKIPFFPVGRYYRYRLDQIEQYERREWVAPEAGGA